jgi:putative spermidine/putrescine transport system permease protein
MSRRPGAALFARLGPEYLAYGVGSAVLAFLLLPVFAVVPASFNQSSFISLPPVQLSWRWYHAFAADPEWLRSLATSMVVASLATAVSVAIGMLAALGIERAAPGVRRLVIGLVLSPLIVPVIMTSIALYYVTRYFGLHGTITGLALGHTLLCLPFVVINVGIALRGVDPSCYRAAQGLGASPWRVFHTLTLPLILPSLVGGAVFSFVTSFDEVVIAIFIASDNVKTLPVKLWEIVRVEITPVAAVSSTLLLALTVVAFAVVQLARRGRTDV